MNKHRLLSSFILIFSSFMMSCHNHEAKSDSIKTRIVRYGSLIGLKKDFEERYIILHKHTFPGVLDQIRNCNIRNYSIFLKAGMLFSHFEYIGSDFKNDMAQMANEVTREWWKLTDPMQEPLENRKQGEWWASMELLYQMDTSRIDYEYARRFALVGRLKENQIQNFKQRLDLIDKSMEKLILSAQFQNLTFYSWENQIYFYFEYGGADYEADMARLMNTDKWQRLNSDLKELMQPVSEKDVDRTWQPMQEVFHTN
jgi:L-rhamnose mutarotase